MLQLSMTDARKIQLDRQGLRTNSAFGVGKSAAVKAIRRLSYIQIDTISVVQRAHHHVLWSRVPDYKPELLHQLQTKDKAVLEYWSHAAAYLPIESYRFCLPRMIRYREGESHWWARDKKMMRTVLNRIKKEGPLRARDFESTLSRKSGPWFDRSPQKKALEYLFHEGQLLISERRGFQKVYELAERYLPDTVDQTEPSQSEYLRHLITSAISANGLATVKEIAYLRRGLATKVQEQISQMTTEKKLVVAEVKGLSDLFYLNHQFEVPSSKPQDVLHILNPFDNLVIQRARLKKLFNFDYEIECYVPEAKRKFGYFVLPLLWKDQFIGRLDAKADRAKSNLIIKSMHLEPDFKKILEAAPALANSLKRFAQFNSCETITIDELPLKIRKSMAPLLK